MNMMTNKAGLRGVSLIEASRLHLAQSQMTYRYHLRDGIEKGALQLYWGLTSFIHAFVPGFFTGTAAKGNIRIFYEKLYQHPNPEFRALIDEYERRLHRRSASE